MKSQFSKIKKFTWVVMYEYNFGPDKTGTVKTYAVIKSGFKKVDSTGKSDPIPSRKAQSVWYVFQPIYLCKINLKHVCEQAKFNNL